MILTWKEPIQLPKLRSMKLRRALMLNSSIFFSSSSTVGVDDDDDDDDDNLFFFNGDFWRVRIGWMGRINGLGFKKFECICWILLEKIVVWLGGTEMEDRVAIGEWKVLLEQNIATENSSYPYKRRAEESFISFIRWYNTEYIYINLILKIKKNTLIHKI